MSLSHLDEQGNARMVNMGAKADTERMAVAAGEIHMRPETLALIRAGHIKKGDVLTVAQLAGVMAAKRSRSSHVAACACAYSPRWRSIRAPAPAM